MRFNGQAPMRSTAALAGKDRMDNSADAVAMGSEPPERVHLIGIDIVASAPPASATNADAVAVDTSQDIVADAVVDAPR
eukprot:2968361-Pyramimonas_sp.AAC.1